MMVVKKWRLVEKRVPDGVVYDVWENGRLCFTVTPEDAQGFIFNRASRDDLVEEHYMDGTSGTWSKADWDAAAYENALRLARIGGTHG